MMYHEGRASQWRSSATRAFPHESCEFGQLTVNSPAPRLTHALKPDVESMEPIRLISPTSVLCGFYPQVLSVRYSSLDNSPNLDTGMRSYGFLYTSFTVCSGLPFLGSPRPGRNATWH